MTRPLHVLVFAGTYLYAILHPDKETRFLHELLARGYSVRRAILDTHQPRYPPEALPRSPGIPSRLARTLEQGLLWLPWADVVVVPVHRNSPTIVEWARALGKVTVQHDDHGGTDSRYVGADWVAVKGPWFHEQMCRRHPQLVGRVISTGSIEQDEVQTVEARAWTREAFCSEYGLDPGKRIAVWLPGATFTQDERSKAFTTGQIYA